ncbi:MAG: 2-phosphoglycerate kinase [Candidatus Rifleibacteriota bacterium]
MIILIGGTSCTGKTRLAEKLMRQLAIPFFSLDILMMGIFRSNPDCGFCPDDPDHSVAQKVWPIIREMVKTDIENGRNQIYEGVQIRPDFMADLSSYYSSNIISYFLTFSENYLRTGYNEIIKYRTAVEGRSDWPTLEEMLESSQNLTRECRIHGCNLLEIEKNYIEEMAGFQLLISEKVNCAL